MFIVYTTLCKCPSFRRFVFAAPPHPLLQYYVVWVIKSNCYGSFFNSKSAVIPSAGKELANDVNNIDVLHNVMIYIIILFIGNFDRTLFFYAITEEKYLHVHLLKKLLYIFNFNYKQYKAASNISNE